MRQPMYTTRIHRNGDDAEGRVVTVYGLGALAYLARRYFTVGTQFIGYRDGGR